MHLQILGTAAAEGWPALFCNCASCLAARRLGGKDLRTRSSLQIDSAWKIDFPPDTLQHVQRYGLPLWELRHLFFTHSHQDHMDVNDLLMMSPPFGFNDFQTDPLNIYLSRDAARRLTEQTSGERALPVELHLLRPFEPVQADTLTATPVLAVHDTGEECLFYVLEQDGKTVLFASDTGPFPEATWEFLLTRQFDLVIMECTFGPKQVDYAGHMGLSEVIQARERLLAAGAIAPTTPCWITHFSHNAHITHDEFVQMAAPYGIDVAYDGVQLTV